MPRALGGAPTLSVHWRSLGRSLRGNVNACAAQLVLRPGGCGRNTSVLIGTLLATKNKIFRGSSAMPQSIQKEYRGAAYCASPDQHFKAKPLGRAWCGHAHPTTTLRRENLGAFTLQRRGLNFAASKNKKQIFQGGRN
jgi:hypothetical protein